MFQHVQVVDLSNGNVIEGPGRVKDTTTAAAGDVVVVSTPAEAAPVSTPVSTPVQASAPTPVPAPAADHQTELKDLMQRLVSIERNLSNCCSSTPPSAGKQCRSRAMSLACRAVIEMLSWEPTLLACRHVWLPWLCRGQQQPAQEAPHAGGLHGLREPVRCSVVME